MACPGINYHPVAGASELTERLLATAHTDYDIKYQGYLANHLPHGMYTLCALGASTDRLQEFYHMYVKRLEPITEPKTIIDSTSWEAKIGTQNLYSDYMRFFDSEIIMKGFKATFELYFSQLMGESLGAALHPLINVGYAMEFSNPILLSEGLAYICVTPLKDTQRILNDDKSIRPNVETTVHDLIEELQTIQFPEARNEHWSFSVKRERLLETHWMIFKDLIAKWDLSRDDQLTAKLNELTEASILGVFGTYPKQIDFFLLHGLTGNHAVRVLFPYLSEPMQRQLLKVNLLGLLTACVVQECPKIDVGLAIGYKPEETTAWDSIIEKAILIDEEHVMKVVRTVVYYMETVPLSQRSTIFTDSFLKHCAFKIVDLVQEHDNYKF